MRNKTFSPEVLELDCASETERISQRLREYVLRLFKKKGLVVALSGGIDSSVVGALAVRALGPEHVLGLLMPERDSCSDTLQLSQLIARHLDIQTIHEDITPILESAKCYQRRDEAVRKVIPQFGPGWKSKIVLPGVLNSDQYRLFSVVAQSPDGQRVEARLTLEAYLGVVAATNFKQRTRKMLEYYHADRLNFAVGGTPNRLEYDQGFFVKLGDGAADFKPIAHLYKTQVYQMAEYLQVPEAIRSRPPTTDTYSLAQTQEEFYFSVPYSQMDLILYAKDHGLKPEQVSQEIGLSTEQLRRVFRDLESKRLMACYLHAPPILVEEMPCRSEKCSWTLDCPLGPRA